MELDRNQTSEVQQDEGDFHSNEVTGRQVVASFCTAMCQAQTSPKKSTMTLLHCSEMIKDDNPKRKTWIEDGLIASMWGSARGRIRASIRARPRKPRH